MAQGTAPKTTPAARSLGFEGGLTIALQVKDRKRAMQWYQDVLGFTLLYEVDDIGWCELATPTEHVAIGLSEVEHPKVGGGPVPTWNVKDLDATRKTLESRKVRFDGDTVVIPDMVKLATFYDPDGNALMLAQTLADFG